MSPKSKTLAKTDAVARGSESYRKGYSFEDAVAEAYRLLNYRVEHGRLFSGRQVDIFLELIHGDLHLRRAVECKAGTVTADDLDKFLLKLNLVQKEYPDVRGTIVSRMSFTDQVTSHAAAIGLQLTLYRDLSAQILDGPSYAQALIREIEQNDRYVPSLFVEPQIAHESAGEGQKAFDALSQWLQDGSWNQLTLLGDVGTGKSFLCRMLALRLAKEYLAKPTESPLPLLVDLRNADREFSLEGLILTHFAGHGLARATFDIFDFLLSEGRLVLILDGFDEMASKVTPLITTRNFHELARSVKRSAKVLLTCRTHYFKSRTEEEEVVLGGPDPNLSDVARDLYWDLISRSGFKIAYLQSFSIRHIEEYVNKACCENSASVLVKIRKIYNLAELSQRPLLLEMIVKSVDKLTISEVSSAKLYEIFTNAWIHRDRWRDVMRPEDKLTFLTALARSLWEQEKTSVDYRKLEEYVDSELAVLIDEPRRAVEINAEIRTASFLVRNDHGHYGFAHSSYAEYFLARYLAHQITSRNIKHLAIRRLTNEVIDFLLCLVNTATLESDLTALLQKTYQPLLSENAFLILYRMRRNLLIEEKGRGSDTSDLQVEMPSHAQLQGSKLTQVNMEGVILHSAQLDGADLRQGIAARANLTYASLRAVSANKADFRGANLQGADMTNAILTEVNFQAANVAGTNFTEADLSGSMLTAKNVSQAIFQGATLRSAIVPPGSEDIIFGFSGVNHSPEWNQAASIKGLFEWARRYATGAARTPGALFEADDVAADVVVYVLSRPTEVARLRDFTPEELRGFAFALARRAISNLRGWRPSNVLSLVLDHNKIEQPDDTADDFENALSLEEDQQPRDLINLLPAPNQHIESRLLIDNLKDILSDEALLMLIARYVEGKTLTEIAQEKGLSEMTVLRQLNKSRELARKALGT